MIKGLLEVIVIWMVAIGIIGVYAWFMGEFLR